MSCVRATSLLRTRKCRHAEVIVVVGVAVKSSDSGGVASKAPSTCTLYACS